MPLIIPQSVLEILDGIESDVQPLVEYEVGSLLSGKLQAEGLLEEERKGAWSEVSAFNFTSMDPEHESCWGTHFGPVFQQTLQDGTSIENPNIKDIDTEIIGHWKVRARSTQHPVLKARYADLVWDLGPLVTKEKPDIEFAQLAIDGYIESVNRRLYGRSATGRQQGLRAWELALRISERARIERAIDALFTLHVQLTQHDAVSGWTFLFDHLFGNKKAPLSEEQRNKIIELLETDLARCSSRASAEGFSPWNAKAIGERLASHYQRTGKRDDLERVVRCYCGAFEAISEEANGMLGMSWLHTTAEDYRRHGMVADAERVQIAGTAKGKEASDEMQEITVSSSITQCEIDDYFDAMTQGELTDVLRRIASGFIPRTSDARKALDVLQSELPLMALIGVERISDGHISGRAGSIAEDPLGRLYFKISESISIHSFFLSGCLEKAFERHSLTAELILDEIYAAPIFEADKRSLISYGLTAYFRKDHIAAISVLVPQIEQALRVLLQILGVPVNKPKRDGTMQLKNLNDILREEVVVKALGEDITNYLIVLLGDARGWNLRNKLCHGLVNSDSFLQEVSDRVFHCLLALGFIRRGTPSVEET